MKRLILILLILSLISCKQSLEDYLENFFGSKNYKILEKKIVDDNTPFILAVKYRNDNKTFIESAIVLQKKDEKIIPHLLINQNGNIFDRKGNEIFDSQYTIYGWSVGSLSKNGIDIGCYFDRDRAGDVIIVWDSKTKLYKLFIEPEDSE